MPLDLPETANEVVQRSKTDVQRSLPGSNPSLENSWLGSLVTAFANRIFDFYVQLQTAINLSFPDTTSGTFLDRWSSIYGVPRNAATQSVGNIVATGTDTVVIPSGTGYTSTNSLNYLSTANATLTAQVLSVDTISKAGFIVTVTTDVDHGIASNVLVTMAGVDQSDYNGVQEIIVIAADQFQYEITTSPADPTGATITASFTAASVPVQSVEFESDDETVNQTLDAVLSISSPIAGVDSKANVDFDGIEGGVAQESDAALSERLSNRIQNPVAHFSVADIENQALTVSGVTRVFVEPVFPTTGQVTVYFLRDNDPSNIPNQAEIDTVKETLVEILPANTAESDLIVDAPTASVTNFTFTALDPDTTIMREAVDASLKQFFDEETEVSLTVVSEKYISAIISTTDSSGEELNSFTLSSPTSNLPVTKGQIATLGTITYT